MRHQRNNLTLYIFFYIIIVNTHQTLAQMSFSFGHAAARDSAQQARDVVVYCIEMPCVEKFYGVLQKSCGVL